MNNMNNIKNFDNFDKQDVITETKKTLSSLLIDNKINESATQNSSEFNLESVLESINSLNVKISGKSNEYLVLIINDFDASKALGSHMWDFSYDEKHWNEFCRDGAYVIYFVYDFTKSIDDKHHMFALNIDLHGKIYSGWWYDCTKMEDPQSYCDSIDI